MILYPKLKKNLHYIRSSWRDWIKALLATDCETVTKDNNIQYGNVLNSFCKRSEDVQVAYRLSAWKLESANRATNSHLVCVVRFALTPSENVRIRLPPGKICSLAIDGCQLWERQLNLKSVRRTFFVSDLDQTIQCDWTSDSRLVPPPCHWRLDGKLRVWAWTCEILY